MSWNLLFQIIIYRCCYSLIHSKNDIKSYFFNWKTIHFKHILDKNFSTTSIIVCFSFPFVPNELDKCNKDSTWNSWDHSNLWLLPNDSKSYIRKLSEISNILERIDGVWCRNDISQQDMTLFVSYSMFRRLRWIFCGRITSVDSILYMIACYAMIFIDRSTMSDINWNIIFKRTKLTIPHYN